MERYFVGTKVTNWPKQKITDFLKSPVKKELNTALCHAVVTNDVPLAKLARKRGASVNIKGEENYSLLAMACQNGCLAMVQFLLRCGTKAKHDLMAHAYESNKQDKLMIIAALLKQGIKPQYMGKPLLLCACESDEELELLNLLLKAGVSTTKRANKGLCPLVVACSYRNWQAAALLLKKLKGHVDNTDEQRRTALMLACSAGQYELVKALLKRNAKAAILCRRGMWAYDYARDVRIQNLIEVHKIRGKSARR